MCENSVVQPNTNELHFLGVLNNHW